MSDTIESDTAESNLTQTRDEEDILNILVATDIHLGFEEKDPIRDSNFIPLTKLLFNDFVLVRLRVFYIKYGLFLLRYCLGDKPVEIEFLSDPAHNFKNLTTPTVNYEDPNLNVSIPVFSIHGNHDDPTGQKQISALDLLSTTGLGQTKLALYGLSHIKDERLGRLFLDKKVKMLAPEKEDEWFNLLIWHQNRATRGVKNFIPDDSLPRFLDLVIWGHEHDCRIAAERKTNDVYVSQPGSSVATSLAPGEAIPKKIVLKNLNEMDEGQRGNALTHSELTMQLVTEKVNDMITKAKNLGRTGRASEKPLIRLNVKYRDERQVFNAIRFGQSYMGKVANPEDMVKCQAIKEPVSDILADRVEDIVLQHFSENDTLKCFPVDSITEAVKKYIDSNDIEAPHIMKETIKKLEETMPEIEEIDQCIVDFKRSKEQNSANFVS
ncbi:hypothetical protein NQ314_019317 [Rhamnusium bicolor]|uniref:Mre11 DNA-binding domain-containing protein n=1 Tax=Rhamnusium bicolor TaxID=1586634 RepID=A0AAV8WPQ8_9CUCU|nr:hypothetical protein NQ314_019317 [Rhamnusium bicolor]